MADNFSFSMATAPAQAELKRMQRSMQTANVSAVRAAGAALTKVARAHAPVYSGDRADVPRGRLRKSISAGKVERVGLSSASVKVGPRGPIVHLYAGKIEAEDPFMSPAYRESAGELATIAAVAYAAALEKKL